MTENSEKYDTAIKAMKGLIDAIECKDDRCGKSIIFYFLSVFHEVGKEVVATYEVLDPNSVQGMLGYNFNKIVSKHFRLVADRIDAACEEHSH